MVNSSRAHITVMSRVSILPVALSCRLTKSGIPGRIGAVGVALGLVHPIFAWRVRGALLNRGQIATTLHQKLLSETNSTGIRG